MLDGSRVEHLIPKVALCALSGVWWTPCFSSTMVEVENVGTSLHIEFLSKKPEDFAVREVSPGKLELTVLGLSPEARKKILDLKKHPLVDSIQSSVGTDQARDVVTIQTSASWFSYLANQPSRFVLDLFSKKKSEVVELSKPKATQGATGQQIGADGVTKSTTSQARDPASEFAFDIKASPEALKRRGVFDGADPDFLRFRVSDSDMDPETLIKNSRKVYLRFPVLEDDFKYLSLLETTFPIYKISEEQGEANRVARLILNLYELENHALFAKVKGIFEKNHSRSKYLEMLDYMEADLNYRLWMSSKKNEDFLISFEKYGVAAARYPSSELAPRAHLMRGFSALKQRDYLKASSALGKYITLYPDSKRSSEVLMGMAMAHRKLGKYKEATKFHLQAMEKSSGPGQKIEGAYRLGDISIAEGRYQDAMSAYQQAIRLYPEQADQFPNAFFNSAESLFWLGKYRESADQHLQFLVRFPDHGHAPYSMTRIGEIFERVGKNEEKAVGAWLETFFRYGKTDGSSVARVRYLSRRMAGAKGPELKEILAELESIAVNSSLAKIQDFKELMAAEGFYKKGEREKAIDRLRSFYEKYPSEERKSLITGIIQGYAADLFASNLKEKKFEESMRVYDRYNESWLKNTDRVDIDFFLGQNALHASAAGLAAKHFQRSLLQLERAQIKPKSFQEKKYFEFIPERDALLMRLSQAQFADGKIDASLNTIRKIDSSDLSALNENEKIEYHLLSADLNQKLGNTEIALRSLKKFSEVYKGPPSKLLGLMVRVADLQERAGEKTSAMQNLEAAIESFDNRVESTKRDHARALERLGDLYLSSGKPERTIRLWGEFLKLYSDHEAANPVRFKLGKVLFQNGDLKDAEQVWGQLDPKEAPTWVELARDQMRSKEWNEEYRKYQSRIPAMSSDIKEGSQ